MNLDKLQSKLLAAAREVPPSDAVPYAFEKRVMARIRSFPRTDLVSLWNRMLWRAAVPSLLIMISVSFWALMSPNSKGSADLGTELEEVVLAPAYAAIEETW